MIIRMIKTGVVILSFSFLTYGQHTNILLGSIPKCGTWLLDKLVNNITGKHHNLHRLGAAGILKSPKAPTNAIQLFTPNIYIFDKCTNLAQDEFLVAHLTYDNRYEKILKDKNFKKILIIRDPRDQVVSRAFYFLKPPHALNCPGVKDIPFDRLLTMLIGDNSVPHFADLLTSHISYIEKPKAEYISNVASFYNVFLGWMQSPICYTTTFEKIVGSRGGGSDEVQRQEIANIAKFLNNELSQERLDEIIQNLFGGTATFREGKIGSWKQHFTEEHKRQFKAVAGQLLIDLGYEKDMNW